MCNNIDNSYCVYIVLQTLSMIISVNRLWIQPECSRNHLYDLSCINSSDCFCTVCLVLMLLQNCCCLLLLLNELLVLLLLTNLTCSELGTFLHMHTQTYECVQPYMVLCLYTCVNMITLIATRKKIHTTYSSPQPTRKHHHGESTAVLIM